MDSGNCGRIKLGVSLQTALDYLCMFGKKWYSKRYNSYISISCKEKGDIAITL
ncbi:MAG: hypothetical protein K2H41_13620 [Acetatifactor sp.]|nr:hypothetical protein [Acetatifactor sp.]MDE7113104.1 hypothetical protein [Acetatifactor sp.]